MHCKSNLQKGQNYVFHLRFITRKKHLFLLSLQIVCYINTNNLNQQKMFFPIEKVIIFHLRFITGKCFVNFTKLFLQFVVLYFSGIVPAHMHEIPITNHK